MYITRLLNLSRAPRKFPERARAAFDAYIEIDVHVCASQPLLRVRSNWRNCEIGASRHTRADHVPRDPKTKWMPPLDLGVLKYSWLADDIPAAAGCTCAYVRTDTHMGAAAPPSRQRLDERTRQRERERAKRAKRASAPSSSAEVAGYSGSASSGALESPDTPSSATGAMGELAYLVRRSSIRRDIAIHTSETLFAIREISVWLEIQAASETRCLRANANPLICTHRIF